MMSDQSSLHDPAVEQVLADLYADHERHRAAIRDQPRPFDAPKPTTTYERFAALKHHYMPIDRPFGHLMYSLIRATGAETIVEFGTSFGISTIYLAAAVRDNGRGKVITTEFIEEKTETARANLTRAGLVDCVEFRVGDAMQTLAESNADPLPGPIDFLFLDGEKAMYVDIVKLLEPRMRSSCLVVSDNTDQPGAASYLQHVRDPDAGYITTALLTAGGEKQHSGHELSVRL